MQYIEEVLQSVKESNPNEPEFYQAVEEVLSSINQVVEGNSEYQQQAILERLVEPERQVIFRVPWLDDDGKVQVNRGFRIEFSSTLGPYKGGLRLHPSVNKSVVKFLGFEQVLKNALTGLQLGGAKGGADFNPKGKSDNEIMRFCQSYMTELYRHIGANTDVPAGDIGVGAREIGYLFGQYKRITNQFEGVLTGKPEIMGGSSLRTEATGYGVAYFLSAMLDAKGDSLRGKRCLASGAGNVALYLMEKLDQYDAVILSCSDSKGTLYCKDGLDVALVKHLKNERGAELRDYLNEHKGAEFTPVNQYPSDGHQVWRYEADIALPCATQNEITEKDAEALVENGCSVVCEGANMPTTADALKVFKDNDVFLGPSKAANAGGVATSQFEMAQNASMQKWRAEQVDEKLQQVMKSIFDTISATAKQYSNEHDLVLGANIAGFERVADAMLKQGVV
ncbi:NADP-specific glutamate dehydrogenase [Pseudoalteromonas sp. P1-8]|uniref:NADP-specific glutamate dehydrogenase n=1 Tax=Pseudoalteromonas sp. P1-8 TaxID=1710353 RepID=UPI0006DBED59|nr:NADP-specific glutamate dehydrogenase [Pseudoalteromonas sp. P1-8]KPW00559.1 NAD(P)-specific glutamate dehydrogenase [Pseudoalteromonas sp. P1-8]